MKLPNYDVVFIGAYPPPPIDEVSRRAAELTYQWVDKVIRMHQREPVSFLLATLTRRWGLSGRNAGAQSSTEHFCQAQLGNTDQRCITTIVTDLLR